MKTELAVAAEALPYRVRRRKCVGRRVQGIDAERRCRTVACLADKGVLLADIPVAADLNGERVTAAVDHHADVDAV